MSQKYKDWVLTESKECGSYTYTIIKATDIEDKIIWKGFVVFADGADYWLENENRDGVRMALIILGQQRA